MKAFRPVVLTMIFIPAQRNRKRASGVKNEAGGLNNQVIYFIWPYLAFLDLFPCFSFVLKLQVDKGLTQLLQNNVFA